MFEFGTRRVQAGDDKIFPIGFEFSSAASRSDEKSLSYFALIVFVGRERRVASTREFARAAFLLQKKFQLHFMHYFLFRRISANFLFFVLSDVPALLCSKRSL